MVVENGLDIENRTSIMEIVKCEVQEISLVNWIEDYRYPPLEVATSQG